MSDVYQQLARHLDNLPAGYPATESGVELRILKRLFSEEEARIAADLVMMPETADAIATRTGRDAADLTPTLEDMAKKGLIFRAERHGETYFMAAQFVIGIWEYHLNDLDPELIKDVNEYLPTLMTKNWTTQETKQLRVIPVSKELSADFSVTPYDVAEEIIRKQSKIVVSPCICRKENSMMGHGCDNPMEVCLSFGSGAYYYEKNGLGRSIDKEEALGILEKGRAAGLVLQPGNAQKPVNICMCCGCCCQVLKNLKNLDKPAAVVHTNYYAAVDEDECIACGDCVDRCHMAAITVEDAAVVDRDRCIGCGVCIADCPTEAIALHLKDDAEQYVPPRNVMETYVKMAQERGKL